MYSTSSYLHHCHHLILSHHYFCLECDRCLWTSLLLWSLPFIFSKVEQCHSLLKPLPILVLVKSDSLPSSISSYKIWCDFNSLTSFPSIPLPIYPDPLALWKFQGHTRDSPALGPSPWSAQHSLLECSLFNYAQFLCSLIINFSFLKHYLQSKTLTCAFYLKLHNTPSISSSPALFSSIVLITS